MLKNDLIELLILIIDNGKYSNVELNNLFCRKNYNQKQKAFIKTLLNITLKNLIYIDSLISKFSNKISKKKIKHLIRLSVAQIIFMDSDNKGVVYEAIEIAKQINIHQAKFVNSILNNIIREYENIEFSDDIKYSCPKWLYDKLYKNWGSDTNKFLKASKNQSYLCLRINENRISSEKFCDILAKANTDILFNVENFYYISNNNPIENKMLDSDQIIIQDLASFVVVDNLDIKNTDVVLDACSAPGGKSFGVMQNNPKLLYSTDIFDFKIDILNNMKVNFGFDNMIVEKKDATLDNNYSYNFFDKILLDVPCSGLGVLRRKPEKIYTLTNENINELSKLQRKIFDNNIKYLKDDGIIIYSTCTITYEENTKNIEYFMKKYNLEPIKLKIPDKIKYIEDKYSGVYLSHENSYVDNFYIIKLKKVNNENKN